MRSDATAPDRMPRSALAAAGRAAEQGAQGGAARCSARRFADEAGKFDRSSIAFAAVEGRNPPATQSPHKTK